MGFIVLTEFIQFCFNSYYFYFAAPSLPIGTTVGSNASGVAGSALNALSYPCGLALDCNGSIYTGDTGNDRVIKLQEGSLVGSVVAGTGTSGNTNA